MRSKQKVALSSIFSRHYGSGIFNETLADSTSKCCREQQNQQQLLHPHKNSAEERKTLGMDFPYQLFLLSSSASPFSVLPQPSAAKTPAVLEKDEEKKSIGFSFSSRNLPLSAFPSLSLIQHYFSRIKDCWILKTRASSAPWTSFFHSMWFLSGSFLSTFLLVPSRLSSRRVNAEEACRDVACSVFEMWKRKIISNLVRPIVKNLWTRSLSCKLPWNMKVFFLSIENLNG